MAIVSDKLKIRSIKPPLQPTTFESISFTFGKGSSTIAVLLIHRPGSSAPTKLFFDELTSYLEMFVLYKCHIVVAGDMNIHVDDSNDSTPEHILIFLKALNACNKSLSPCKSGAIFWIT